MDSIDIYFTLSSKKHNPHHLNRYIKFISSCIESNKTLDDSVYTEKHHICPKSLFPKYKNLKKHPENLAVLTARQHFVAHWMLARAYGGKMYYAMSSMINQRSTEDQRTNRYTPKSSRVYELFKKEFVVTIREFQKTLWTDERRKEYSEKFKGEKGPFYGRNHTEETKKASSERMSGENHPFFGTKRPEHAIIVSELFKGVPKTEEHRENISKSHNKEYTCPHCSQTGGRMLLRFHFDHCYLVDESKPLYRATDPDGNEELFGYLDGFIKKHKLSRKALETALKTHDGVCVKGRNCTVFGQAFLNTLGWRFIRIR